MKQVALFNHKGGVSKTTTTFHLGWTLASKGYRVIVVDADPQCNLSGLILGLTGEDEFEDFYASETQKNIRAGLQPAFDAQVRLITHVECIPVPRRDGMFLLPGHIRLAEYEVTLGIAQELSQSIQTLRNLPGSLAYLLEKTAEHYGADYVLVDMNPSLSAINQNLLMTSDFFVVPTSPDYFSVMAIESLATVLPRWNAWNEKAKDNPILSDAAYPYPKKTPKFLGTIIQKYRLRKGAPTVGFKRWVDQINDRVEHRLVPTLKDCNMLLSEDVYDRIDHLRPSLCLAQISDFNTLIAKSQEFRVPVFELSDEQVGYVGVVLDADKLKREEFMGSFSALADTVVALTQ